MNLKKRLIVVACIALLSIGALIALQRSEDERVRGMTEDLFSDPLGMVLIDIADEKAASSYHVDALGVYVLAVDEESQAYAAGVRSGDRLVSVNGRPVQSTNEFMLAQEAFRAHQRVSLNFRRGRELRPLTAELLWSMDASHQ